MKIEKFVGSVVLAIVAFLILVLTACGAPTTAEPPEVSLIEAPILPTTTTTTIPPPPLEPIASVDAFPERLSAKQVTETLPPPTTRVRTPQELVNGLPYDYVDGKDVGLEAFRIVAYWNGWSAAKTEAWLPFADDVISKESGYCWNTFGGAIVSTNGCVISRQGTGQDAGFGQLTEVHHGRGMWLCTIYGVCGRDAVVRDPWTSMSAVVWLLDREGSGPWCYSPWARSFHKCGLAPDR